MQDDRFCTRKEGVRLVNERLGIPLSLSVVEKAACTGRGPEVAAYYGKTHLYKIDSFLAWAKGLLKEGDAAA